MAVKRDKEREVNDGHDGTWVAHPGLVPLAKEVIALVALMMMMMMMMIM